VTTSVTGGAGVIAASVPFVGSLAPSERARAFGAPVEVDIASIKPGELRTVEWRGKPAWVLRRTPQMIDALRKDDDLPGGFYCPCHGSKFDLAGRVFKNVPAPSNLEVPPHRYASDTLLVIGADAKG
jgi:ubiquinol-cytochrome c reductase iron-sulfur subunit